MRQALSLSWALALVLVMSLAGASAMAATPTSRTNVDTVPSGASVFLLEGGIEKPIGTTPLKLFRLPRGVIQLKFKKDGFEDSVQTVTIAARVDTFVFTLTRAIKPATIELISAAEFTGATVSVSGKPVGVLPANTSVPPGRYQIVVEKPGYQKWERWIDAAEGQKATYDVVLTKVEAPKGTIVVSSNPSNAEVRINGSPQGRTPAVVDELVAGPYLVEVALPDHVTFSQTITVEPGKRAVIDAQLQKSKGDTGEVKVLVTGAEGTTVYLDGESIGPAPATASGVKPGTHHIEVKNDKGYYGEQMAEVKAGEVTVVRVAVKQTASPTEAAVRVVASRPGGTVRVDNGEPKPLPAQLTGLEPGTHIFTVQIEGFADWVKTVTLQPGTNPEIIAQVEQSGRIEVRTKKDGERAQVFVNGKPLGQTPFIGELPAGTHTLLVQREDGANEEFQLAVAPDRVVKVTAAFGADKPKAQVKHRPMPLSGRAVSAGTGHVSVIVSWPQWPFPVTARAGGGIGNGMDINVELRSAFHVINELVGYFKWTFVDTSTLAVGVEAGIGGGLGADDRSSFVFHANAKGSLMIGEKAAITLKLGTLVHADSTGPGEDDSDSGARLYLGLGVEFEIFKTGNLLFQLEGDPIGSKRLLYEEALLDDPDPKLYGSVGMSFMF
ncbi:MAG: PEGA domain-containing protein [Deltaproteobacteria bacterium]|nr:PEGA domain-containing protein [Deltaproteobacteria bacterium]